MEYEYEKVNEFDQYENRAMLLNSIKEGVRVEFSNKPDGEVKGIWSNTVYGGTKNIAEMRLHIIHSNGDESYHTYRHDGVSHHDSDSDIIAVYTRKERHWWEGCEGLPVMVRNTESQQWRIDLFKKYKGVMESPFICYTKIWKYARPLTASERDAIKVKG